MPIDCYSCLLSPGAGAVSCVLAICNALLLHVMCSVISLDFEQQPSSYGRIFRCHSVLSFRGVSDFLCVSSSLVNCKVAEMSILLFFHFFSQVCFFIG